MSRTANIDPATRTCCYCDEALTWNEYDDESHSFFASHFRCSSPNADGRYEVVRDLGVYAADTNANRRFSTLKRAISEATYRASANYGGAFAVLDLEAREEVFSAPCLKRDPA